jgi:predicted ArsR family transcriptional regulator
MNTRDKILNHLETNIPASAAQLSKLFGCQKSHINLLLRDLIADGQVEIESISKSVKYYRLSSLHHKRTEAVMRYLDEHETGMAVEISNATGIDKRLVTKMLKHLHENGDLHRDWCHKSKWVYSKKPVGNFGAANPLTAFINQRLREVRSERA